MKPTSISICWRIIFKNSVRSLPLSKVRPTWPEFLSCITDSHFRQTLWMPVGTFNRLCDKVGSVVGKTVFTTKSYLTLTHSHYSNILTEVALEQFRGMIPGEIKMTAFLRILAVRLYLDLNPLFFICNTSIYTIFKDVLKWILGTFSFPPSYFD